MQQKESNETIKSVDKYSLITPYLTIPFNKTTIKPLFKFLHTVIMDFFILQFSVKFKLRKIPVYRVDHKLDNLVPFSPDKVTTYLNFVNFWIRPLSLLITELGVKKAMPYCAEYLTLIERCYKQASLVYKNAMSTTNRPKPNGNRHFMQIHFFDPHLLCVPSLHVAICVLAKTYFKNIFKIINFPEEKQKKWAAEIDEEAIAIIETVLYVKQHSVNCIPAALYMMTHILKDSFSIEDSVNLIEKLFENSTDITSVDKALIRTHIHFMFEELLLEGCNEENWSIPILRWIKSYSSNSENAILAKTSAKIAFS